MLVCHYAYVHRLFADEQLRRLALFGPPDNAPSRGIEAGAPLVDGTPSFIGSVGAIRRSLMAVKDSAGLMREWCAVTKGAPLCPTVDGRPPEASDPLYEVGANGQGGPSLGGPFFWGEGSLKATLLSFFGRILVTGFCELSAAPVDGRPPSILIED